jgi:hypothetical protein
MFEIRKLSPGEKIVEPGFYEMPLEQHHAQPVDGVAVTSSVLRTMELKTPADVWAFHQLNKNRWERKETTALRLGRAMAAFVEKQEAGVRELFMVLPPNRPNRPTEAQLDRYEAGNPTDAGKKSVEFWKMVAADPRSHITADEFQLIVNMGMALVEDPAACAALGGHPEITMAWHDDETDLWCLARPDQTSFSGMLSDYKKMNAAGQPFDHRLVDRRITAHGYDMQMAFGAEGFQHLTGEWPDQVGIVAQVDEPPFHVILREISEEDLEMAAFRNRRARIRFRECLDSGHWPGPGEDVGVYQRPQWLRDQLLEQMNQAMA